MASTIVGVIRETVPGENRVALTPDTVGAVAALGMTTLVETTAGARAWWPDGAYAAAGAHVVSCNELFARADVVLSVDGSDNGTGRRLHPGQALIGLLRPLAHPSLVRTWLDCGLTTISLDLLPRNVTAARSMDAVASQAAIAGYKAAVLAADTYGGFFPMSPAVPGAGWPARVLVLGDGPAAAEAVATARRLGAEVTRREIGSPDQRGDWIAEFDVVITTAQRPGCRPPTLVTLSALHRMSPGSVIVDLAAGPLGGNVEGSDMDSTELLGSGVIVLGAGNLPARMAPAAATLYAHNIIALLGHLARDGVVTVDPADEIQSVLVVTHAGRIVSTRVAESQRRAIAAGTVR
ncbi:MAG TPA: NAD(P)(+) transhydrogenase (Re/Si-specific) subunit alpha [Pseudonocardiaceae bacterium]